MGVFNYDYCTEKIQVFCRIGRLREVVACERWSLARGGRSEGFDCTCFFYVTSNINLFLTQFSCHTILVIELSRGLAARYPVLC